MKNNITERFTISFYEGNFKDEMLLKTVNFHSNSERFRGNKIKEWAYEYIKEHPELLKEMQMANDLESVVAIETKDNPKTNKEKQIKKTESKLNIIVSKNKSE